MTTPIVSVIVPAFAEERWIERCLDAIEAQQHPHDLLEVIVVVDGKSIDATEPRARARLDGHTYKQAVVLRNEHGGTPSNLNCGLSVASGSVVCRIDARSLVRPDYVGVCADVLTRRPDVSVVGGTPIAVAGSDSSVAAGIARAFNNRLAMGWSRHHRGASSGPSDTVYLGAFRTDELKAVGGWNEDFDTNQDFELNRRMSRRGVVWFDDRLEVGYVTRTSITALHRHFTRFGRAKVRYWLLTGDRPRPRQLVLLLAPVVAVGISGASLVRAHRRGRLATLVAVVALGAAVECAGSTRPRGGVKVHAWSALALTAAVSGWLRGVWSALARRAFEHFQ